MSESRGLVVARLCMEETSFMAEVEATREPNWVPACVGAMTSGKASEATILHQGRGSWISDEGRATEGSRR